VLVITVIREISHIATEDAKHAEDVPVAMAVDGIVEFARKVSLRKSVRIDNATHQNQHHRERMKAGRHPRPTACFHKSKEKRCRSKETPKNKEGSYGDGALLHVTAEEGYLDGQEERKQECSPQGIGQPGEASITIEDKRIRTAGHPKQGGSNIRP